MARRLNEKFLTCSICLEIFKEPVTLPCGHSYCRDCIQKNWSRKVNPPCPQCRQSFTPRPDLVKNTVLSSLLEELKSTGLIEPPDLCYAAPGDVSCDVCSGRKLKAVSSCLQCLVSYCDEHLQPHRDVAILWKHQLVAPSDKLQENLCSEHDELKKLFCRTDQQVICSLCCVDQHRGHDTVSSVAERNQRQKHVQTKRSLMLQNLQDKETDLDQLQHEAQDIRRAAQAAVQHSEDSLREMIHLLEKRRSELKQKIQTEERKHLEQVQVVQEQLGRDVTDLKKKISELDKLCLTQDHNQFILLCPSLSTYGEETESRTQTKTRPSKDFDSVSRAVSELRDQLQHNLREFTMFEPEPDSRDNFLRYACDITLDPNTANKCMSLSDGNRKVTLCENQNYPDHPDRFVRYCQALSKERLSCRSYWEVELSVTCILAVSYRDIKRDGNLYESVFGKNNKSWALYCNKHSYSFVFNGCTSAVSGPVSPRIGVYLDHWAGTLSFYSITGQTMSLLHKVQTNFTEPLFAGVAIGDQNGKSIHFLQLK